MSVFRVLRKKGLLSSLGFFNVSPHTLFLIDTGKFEKSDTIKCTMYNRLIKIPLC